MKSILATALVGVLITAVVTAQRGRTPVAPSLPPISMTCVHHPDVIESRAGTCPYCKMALVPVRLDSAWMCPIHSTVTESNPGSCRLCRRQLVPVTVALTWTCRADSTIEHAEPGTCTDGSPRIAHRTLRPHGNHNPQHGGQFFMAPDSWHHLEGVYPSPRVFRLYMYDDFGRPLTGEKMSSVQARVVTRETFDPATRKTTEQSAFSLKVRRNRPYLEARVDTLQLPAEMSAKVKFSDDQPEYRFDFTFTALSKEPAAPAPRARQTQPVAQAVAPAAAVPAPGTDTSLTLLPVPDTMSGILEQLRMRDKQVSELIARGDFGAVWVPAFQAKDLAIALEPHLAHLATARRETGEPALARVVRAAWLLDASGDVGNRRQIESAYTAFTAAVTEVIVTFGGQ